MIKYQRHFNKCIVFSFAIISNYSRLGNDLPKSPRIAIYKIVHTFVRCVRQPVSIILLDYFSHLNSSILTTQPWWRLQMETFSALLTICAENSPASDEFPAQKPVTRRFVVFFDLCLNKRLRKQSWGWWFETLPRPLCRHCNDSSMSDTAKPDTPVTISASNERPLVCTHNRRCNHWIVLL